MKIIGWIIATPFILLLIITVLRSTFCGPNGSDVSVMQSMERAISQYIGRNGVPESLEDIPDLPYEFSGCKKSDYYENYKSYEHVSKEKAKLHQIEEICHFKNIRLEFGITEELDSSEIEGLLRMTSSNETVLIMGFDTKDGKKFDFDKIDIGSSKTRGICNPMRQ